MDLTKQEQARLRELAVTISKGLNEVQTALELLNKVQDKVLMHKLITAGVQGIRKKNLEEKQPLDCHFFYMHAVRFYYRHRAEAKGLDNAKFFCMQQIRLAPKSIAAFKAERMFPLPAHTGYIQLAIIFQKECKYREVMQLCRQAKEQGWNGDWDKRIEKAEKSLAKTAS